MPTKTRLEIELPVCEVCGAASKAVAASMYGGKVFCEGPRGQMHKRTAMKPKTFVEKRAARNPR